MQRTNEEFQKKYQEFLAQADSLPKNIAERRQKELQDMLNVRNSSNKKLIKVCRKHSKMLWLPSIRNWTKPSKLSAKLKVLSTFFDLARTPIPFVGAQSVDVTAKVKTQLGIK
mgnify:CR=1 FL=1